MDSGNKSVKGVITRKGEHFKCKEVVLSTGTFLNGVCHVGHWNVPAGRFFVAFSIRFEPSATRWTQIHPPFTWRTFCTHSTCQCSDSPQEPLHVLNKKSINWSILEEQTSDAHPTPLSFMNLYNNDFIPNQSSLQVCHITYTNPQTHEICNSHRDELPHFTGNGGRGQGPQLLIRP